jgi:hypothetical protein
MSLNKSTFDTRCIFVKFDLESSNAQGAGANLSLKRTGRSRQIEV